MEAFRTIRISRLLEQAQFEADQNIKTQSREERLEQCTNAVKQDVMEAGSIGYWVCDQQSHVIVIKTW